MEVGKNKTGTILIITLLVVLVLSIIGGFTALYIKMTKDTGEVAPPVSTNAISMEEITLFSTGKLIVTNLQEGPDKEDHAIRVNVNLGIDMRKDNAKKSGELLANLETKKPIINDIITSVCRSKTYEELKRNDAKAILKDEILLRLQKKFDTNLIVDVYIDEIFLD